MSVFASSWVWEHSKSKGTARLVLLSLADHAGADGGDAYPSVGRLALRCGLSRRTVQEALKILVNLGELVIEPQAGPHGANRYQLAMTPAESAPPQNPHPADPAPTPSESRTPPTQILHPTPADPAPEPSLTVLEPPRNRPAMTTLGFDAFWRAYPRREGERDAKKAWRSAIQRANPADIIIGAQRYADDPGREDQYTKTPFKWLEGDCWKDEPRRAGKKRAKGTAAVLSWIGDRTGTDDQPRELNR